MSDVEPRTVKTGAMTWTAICDVCGDLAVHVWQSIGRDGGKRERSVLDFRISRSASTCVFSCAEHWDQVGWQMCNEFEGACNYEVDDLAALVDEMAPVNPRKHADG